MRLTRDMLKYQALGELLAHDGSILGGHSSIVEQMLQFQINPHVYI